MKMKRAKLEECDTNISEGLSSIPTNAGESGSGFLNSEIQNHNDLPLLANINQVKVCHYLLHLDFYLERKQVKGIAVLFLKAQVPGVPFEKVILDSRFIDVHDVTLLKNCDDDELKFNPKNFYKSQNNRDWFKDDGPKLNFVVTKWSLTISGWDCDPAKYPTAIRISYSVSSDSESLNWCPTNSFDYDGGQKCVFIAGSPINNRGPFPCQEPPSAMATWECFIKTEKPYQPLLSSDEQPEIVSEDDSTHTYYFYCSMILPMSTFSLVIAKFPLKLEIGDIPELLVELSPDLSKVKCGHEPYFCRLKDAKIAPKRPISCRLFSVDEKRFDFDTEFFRKITLRAVKSLSDILGPHPFTRLDFVILPNLFHVLGLCSPHLIFLSPSLFYGSEPLYIYRVPHEISHNWFGLLIGAIEWEEEFLSEGFATFMEDLIYRRIFLEDENKDKTEIEVQVQVELDSKACLHLLALKNELQNTSEASHLHNLSLKKSETDATFVKNGLEPMKQFMQVHYLKGYFLLKYLAHLVGETNFLEFLKMYVFEFHGQLVSSKILFESYNRMFYTKLEDFDLKFVESLQLEWTFGKEICEPFASCDILGGSLNPDFIKMFPTSEQTIGKIQQALRLLQSNSNLEEFKIYFGGFTSSQKILFLEKVIHMSNEEQDINRRLFMYDRLVKSNTIDANNQNPDLIHRFCELIIFNLDTSKLYIVEGFLERFQALGVYLYGELMISENFRFQKLARQLYKRQKKVLDPTQKKVLYEMIF